MSSAQNHRARSHRSQLRRRSAFGGTARRAGLYGAGRAFGGRGLPLIYKLQAMRQKILESRQKKTEDGGEKEG